MSSERARRFYFTSERDSYGADKRPTSKLFRQCSSDGTQSLLPTSRPVLSMKRMDVGNRSADSRGTGESSVERSDKTRSQDSAAPRKGQVVPQSDDEYAATGIGRSVHNDVRWVNMELDSRPAAEVVIRYEYYSALVRLGVLPRPYPRPDPLRRREGARGFEDRRFSPEP